MSQHNVEVRGDSQPEKPRPMRIEEEFPWFTVIMIAVGLITLIGYVVQYAFYNH